MHCSSSVPRLEVSTEAAKLESSSETPRHRPEHLRTVRLAVLADVVA